MPSHVELFDMPSWFSLRTNSPSDHRVVMKCADVEADSRAKNDSVRFWSP
jgi:hypothetical protein